MSAADDAAARALEENWMLASSAGTRSTSSMNRLIESIKIFLEVTEELEAPPFPDDLTITGEEIPTVADCLVGAVDPFESAPHCVPMSANTPSTAAVPTIR